jgi:nucleoid-associated protein YgaU
MRAFCFGLLVAALAWWFLGRGDGVGAATPSGGPMPTAAGGPQGGAPAGPASGLAAVLPGAGRTAAPALDAGKQVVVPLPSVEDVIARLAAGDAAAVGTAWALVAAGPSAGRGRLLTALQPAQTDFATLLRTLGADNTFLHSAEGRGIASQAVAAAMALPDGEALVAGTQLLELMLKGRITKEDSVPRAFVDETYKQHRIRVDRCLCDPANVAGARSYVVVAGDSLVRIAQKFRKEGLKVEDGTLAVLNRIHNPKGLQAGQKIKVPVDPVSAVVEKRSFSLAVYVGSCLLRLYWVGHGEHDRTPVTDFLVGDKQPQPSWTAPDGEVYPYGHPKNILGEYFIKFLHDSYSGFGAHGTPFDGTIGTMSSMGCIRMVKADIAELFAILPRGAKVSVRATESMR